MLKLLLTLSVVLAVMYVCFGASLLVNQSRFIFLPSRTIFATPEKLELGYRSVTFTTADNLRLHGWFVQADDTAGTILFCHGNGGNIANLLETITIFHDLGFSSFVFDYRGYGQSEGTPSEAGTYLDARAAWEHLVCVEKVKPADIIVFGRSLGGAIAARLGNEFHPRACVLESAFTSAKDMATTMYPLFPGRLLCRFDYNTLADVRKITTPLLIIHSDEDEVIPFSQGRALFAAAHEPKTFLRIKGNHNAGFLASGEIYRRGLRNFFENTTPEEKTSSRLKMHEITT